MNYIFNVARAVKLERVEDLNILNGSLDILNLEKDKYDIQKRYSEHCKEYKDYFIKGTTEIKPDTPKEVEDSINNQLLILLSDLNRINNEIKIRYYDYLIKIIPYFTDEEVIEEDLTAEILETFDTKLKEAVTTIFTPNTGGTEKK